MSDSVVTDESGVDENVDSTDSQPQTEVSTKSAEQVLTEDLQRLQADYSNYRKRVDRDRAVSQCIVLVDLKVREVDTEGREQPLGPDAVTAPIGPVQLDHQLSRLAMTCLMRV